MTDLELTKLCAEAMGWKTKLIEPNGVFRLVQKSPKHEWQHFDPLLDDAHAMMLLKHFKLRVDYDEAALRDEPTWYAQTFNYKRNRWNTPAESNNVNRAIVECVASINGKTA